MIAWTRPSWRDFAACADPSVDRSVFFPEDKDAKAAAEAKQVCRRCPAREACLLDALDRNEPAGIWGGAAEPDFRLLRRARAAGRLDGAVADHFARLDRDEAAPLRDVNGPGATHGLAATYAKGCRCFPCTWAGQERAERESGCRVRPASPKRKVVYMVEVAA
ncbi:MAG TPA: WhiB family transcriptional regulator [Acidimicrobiales bacterium]|jgi:WhiB family redox-sensing transcriptional regulator